MLVFGGICIRWILMTLFHSGLAVGETIRNIRNMIEQILRGEVGREMLFCPDWSLWERMGQAHCQRATLCWCRKGNHVWLKMQAVAVFSTAPVEVLNKKSNYCKKGQPWSALKTSYDALVTVWPSNRVQLKHLIKAGDAVASKYLAKGRKVRWFDLFGSWMLGTES